MGHKAYGVFDECKTAAEVYDKYDAICKEEGYTK
tara:strand:- start:835 stop:936 length:102 start_codon:yes stop_codon:yes gene_type:complete